MKKIDLIGKKFNRLIVLEEMSHKTGRQLRWQCQCDCGNITIVDGSKLKNGHTKSCGCLNIESAGQSSITHHMSKSSEYRIWQGIKNRCNNPNVPSFKYYGGRGTRVCEHWLNSFENFIADVGLRPNTSYTIDRINTLGHYSCGHCSQCKQEGWSANCRWETRSTQSSNRRNNRVYTRNGQTLTLKAWAKEAGIKYGTVYNRVVLAGWPLETALTLAPDSTNRLT